MTAGRRALAVVQLEPSKKSESKASRLRLVPSHVYLYVYVLVALLSGARNAKNSRSSEEMFDRMRTLFPESNDSSAAASIVEHQVGIKPVGRKEACRSVVDRRQRATCRESTASLRSSEHETTASITCGSSALTFSRIVARHNAMSN
jgi:hypothetical protein